jgi:hypothetical protein
MLRAQAVLIDVWWIILRDFDVTTEVPYACLVFFHLKNNNREEYTQAFFPLWNIKDGAPS